MSQTDLDTAYASLYRIQFLQAMAFSAQHELDGKYSIIDYADMLNESVTKLADALERLERSITA